MKSRSPQGKPTVFQHGKATVGKNTMPAVDPPPPPHSMLAVGWLTTFHQNSRSSAKTQRHVFRSRQRLRGDRAGLVPELNIESGGGGVVWTRWTPKLCHDMIFENLRRNVLNIFSIFLRRTKQFHVGFHRFEYLRGFECFVLLLLMLKDRRIFGGYQSDQP